ncbi:hypothetical protein BJ508DRAFT_323917 [Ascobolus immersus RN42]|uniref:F-box domain-containing protein n=1 Tax=Ascobolus immersus RN42 TaxID=1160509 RepID=A0A3N4ICR5_ASCIM|nr:hypothetical protein BJ508DRAFT_323917 [Ascobolus immersus RN42]
MEQANVGSQGIMEEIETHTEPAVVQEARFAKGDAAATHRVPKNPAERAQEAPPLLQNPISGTTPRLLPLAASPSSSPTTALLDPEPKPSLPPVPLSSSPTTTSGKFPFTLLPPELKMLAMSFCTPRTFANILQVNRATNHLFADSPEYLIKLLLQHNTGHRAQSMLIAQEESFGYHCCWKYLVRALADEAMMRPGPQYILRPSTLLANTEFSAIDHCAINNMLRSCLDRSAFHVLDLFEKLLIDNEWTDATIGLSVSDKRRLSRFLNVVGKAASITPVASFLPSLHRAGMDNGVDITLIESLTEITITSRSDGAPVNTLASPNRFII